MKNSANVIRIRPYTSPCGTLLLGSYHDSLCLCDWVESRHPGRTRRRLQSLLGAECVEADSHVLREAASSMIILHMDAPVSTSHFFGSEVISRKRYGRLCSEYLTGRQSHIKNLPSASEPPLPCVLWPMPTEPMPSLSSSLATASSEPTIPSPDMPVASPPKNFY